MNSAFMYEIPIMAENQYGESQKYHLNLKTGIT